MQEEQEVEPDPAPGEEEIILDPRHSRPLDMTVRTDSPALRRLNQQIWDEHFAPEEAEKQKAGRKPAMPYHEQLLVIITDLYLAWQEDPLLCLGMPFSQGSWDS